MCAALIEGGKVVNTHGVRGEIKILPWTSAPNMLSQFRKFTVGGAEYAVLSARVQGGSVVASLAGVTSLEAANALRGQVVYIEKDAAPLAEGERFVADILGLRAVDDATDADFGVIRDFLSLPSNDVYVIEADGEHDGSPRREILIPAVPAFVRELNPEGGYVRFRRIEGM
ncbi:MAG: ribosome maturation factor RimM [Oscillospiraceae bacterium]|jgi:16S rRNA processing protein RimM|nr:ribosome maturation factor RimM [Oscillospiraceae bacterium]